ncbi:MAG: class I SAM-dependent methyltransferase [Alphaproteobacteria bacterium]|nr:class I SAM-dependent methyltransferase [Alphaproteobacteria bacterium]
MALVDQQTSRPAPAGFQTPRANPAARFWDRMAKRYARTPIADEASYQRKLQMSREYLRPESEVLEFGCGTGSTALLHAPYVAHILATDISAKMIEIAQGKADKRGIENVTFLQSDIEALEASSPAYDAIFGLSILHLLEDKEATMGQVHRLLKPGGVFISSTVCLAETMAFFKYIGPIGKFFGLLPHVTVFGKQDLFEALTNAGFEIERQWQPGKGKAVFVVARKPASN